MHIETIDKPTTNRFLVVSFHVEAVRLEFLGCRPPLALDRPFLNRPANHRSRNPHVAMWLAETPGSNLIRLTSEKHETSTRKALAVYSSEYSQYSVRIVQGNASLQ